MSKCPNCGSEETSNYCIICGTPLPVSRAEPEQQSSLSEAGQFLKTWLDKCPVVNKGLF